MSHIRNTLGIIGLRSAIRSEHPVMSVRDLLFTLRNSLGSEVIAWHRDVVGALDAAEREDFLEMLFEAVSHRSLGAYLELLRSRNVKSDSVQEFTRSSPGIVTVTPNTSLDLLVDYDAVFEPGRHAASPFRLEAGGKGIDMSVALSRWGLLPSTCGFYGGVTGDVFEWILRNELHIPTGRLTKIARGRTRIDLTIVTGPDHEHVTSMGPRDVSESEYLELLRSTFDDSREGDFLLVAGSVPPGLPDDIYTNIIIDGNALGMRCFVDTRGAALKASIQAAPFLVGVNLKEFSDLHCPGSMLDPADPASVCRIAATYLDCGIKVVIVSMGENGMVMATHGGMWYSRPPVVKVFSTVGAGDMIKAGFLFGLVKGLDAVGCLAYATAASAAAVTKPGTGLPSLDEVEQLLRAVSITRLG